MVQRSVTTTACRQVWSLVANHFRETACGLPVFLRRRGHCDLRACRSEPRLELNRSRMSRGPVGRRSVREILDRFFSGSARSFVSRLLDSERFSAEDLEAIRSEVDRRPCCEADRKE